VIDEPTRDLPRTRVWTWGRFARDVVLPAAFALLLVFFVWTERDRLDPLSDAPAMDVALLSFLILLAHFLNSTEFWVLYRAGGARSGIFENWFLFIAGQLGNYTPGQAGTLYRLQYMRTVHDVPYSRTVSVYGANFVATLGGAAAVGLVGVIGAAFATEHGLSVVMLLVTLGIAALSVAMAMLPLPKFASRQGRLARAWQSFHEGFEQTRRDPRTAWSVVALEVAKYFVTAWRFQVAFSLLGIDESFWIFLVLAPTAGVASFVAVTPGALGFREGFLTLVAGAMGVGFDVGLLGATIDRAVMLLTSMVFGTIGFAVTYPRFRSARTASAT
jgi:uncharacterized membrane protein YbhN (UPF0104 family)